MSTAATQLQKFIAEYQAGGADKYEIRSANTGTLSAFMADTALISSGRGIINEIDKINVEKGGYSPNGTSISVIQGKDYTINNTSYNTCVATQTANDTALLPVTYSTLSTELFIPNDDYDYNYVGFGYGLKKALKNIADDLAVELNTICQTALETNRNQQQAGYLMSYFTDSTTNEFDVAVANINKMYVNITNQYSAMDYDANLLRVIGNPEHFVTVMEQFAQGTGNATNTNYQYGGTQPNINQITGLFGSLDFYKDSKLANGVGVLQTAFVFPAGSVALIPSVAKKYYSNNLPENSKTQLFASELPSLPGIEWGFRVKDDCVAGNDGISWQIEAKFAAITPYVPNLATDLSPINKYQVK